MRKCYAFLGATLCLSLTTHAQNSALNLIGTNYVTTGVDVVNPNGDFTIEFWAYVPHTMNDGGTHQMVSEGSTGLAFYIGYGPDGAIQIGDAWGSTGIPMVFDKWIHIALSSNSTTFLSDLYINGKLMTEFGGFFFNDDQPFRIGVQTDFSQSFTGKIDEVKAWSTPRTAAQIKGDMFGASDPNDAALVAWYQMNDGHGTSITNDANTTGNSQNGLLSGDAGGTNSWVSSPIQFGNNGLFFNGSNAQVNIPAATTYSYDLATGGTVEFWVNPKTLSGSWSTILGNRGPGGVRYSFHLSSTQIGLDNGTTINTLDYAIPAGTANWTHLAFVMNGATSTIVYVNGTQQGTITGSLGAATNQPLTLGINKNISGADDKPFVGAIDEVRIWKLQRSAADIQTYRDVTLNGSETGLIGQFTFDQGVSNGDNSGLSTAFDNSSQLNHGSMVNFDLSGAASNFTTHVLTVENLPVTISKFTAAPSGNEALLQWQTATEQNSRNFIVQRSSDGSNFTDIATLDAAGNSQALLDYAYTDPQPLKNNNFYRLKQVDLDGKFIYSAVRLVNFPTAAKLLWFATGKGSAQILLQQGNNQPYAVYDAGGRILRLGQLSNGRTQISQLPPGIYFVRVSASTIEIIL
jgi:hypothetical protein